MDVQRRYPFHAILRVEFPQNITGRGWILEPRWEIRRPSSISRWRAASSFAAGSMWASPKGAMETVTG
jgi:hypothetical protein